MAEQNQNPDKHQQWVSSKLVGAEVVDYAGNYYNETTLSLQIKTTTGEIFWLRNGRVEFQPEIGAQPFELEADAFHMDFPGRVEGK